MFTIQKREPGSSWYKYSSCTSEFGATALAEQVKKSYPNCGVRVLNDKGSVCFIT